MNEQQSSRIGCRHHGDKYLQMNSSAFVVSTVTALKYGGTIKTNWLPRNKVVDADATEVDRDIIDTTPRTIYCTAPIGGHDGVPEEVCGLDVAEYVEDEGGWKFTLHAVRMVEADDE